MSIELADTAPEGEGATVARILVVFEEQADHGFLIMQYVQGWSWADHKYCPMSDRFCLGHCEEADLDVLVNAFFCGDSDLEVKYQKQDPK